jgi:adenylosuccinate synthase
MPELVQEGLANAGVEVIYPADWTRVVNHAATTGQVVIEGVQGYGLGLHAGHYPQSTTSDSTAIDFLSAAGLSPWVTDGLAVLVVAREYPIRVAGNSGPLANETTWGKLGLPEERTTVTQKVRRVGAWDPDLINNAVQANGGPPIAVVVLTMVDQKFPHLREVQSVDWHDLEEQIGARHPVWQHLKNVERDAGTTVVGFTTSPTTIAWL